MASANTQPAAKVTPDFKIVLDLPARNPALGFDSVAAALAKIVRTSEPQFAVGIFGGWGTGKSTLMEEIKRGFDQHPEVAVVEFNAWRYEREPHLVVPLLDTVRATFAARAAATTDVGERERVQGLARRIGRVVRGLARATSVDVGLPGATVGVDVGKALDEILGSATDAGASPQSVYYAAFQELRSAFEDLSNANVSRVVVFVDDLDRCLPEQALTVLESMKLFFDLPGFVFVVGLDERVVEAAVRTKFTRGDDDEHLRQVEQEYLKKIFQVPYTIPSMAPGQLDELLDWLERHGGLGQEQVGDLHDRVRRYLSWVAPEGRINPREAKRFINAYTLSRMIQPKLERDPILALQAMDFRPEWQALYHDVVLSEPDVFRRALADLRRPGGDDRTFEDQWPHLGVLPPELLAFLRSTEGGSLQRDDLERYVSLLETTRTGQSGLSEAIRDGGRLRGILRELSDGTRGSSEARLTAADLRDVLGGLRSRISRPSAPFTAALDRLDALANELASQDSADPSDSPGEAISDWRKKAEPAVDAIQAELRTLRRSSSFGY